MKLKVPKLRPLSRWTLRSRLVVAIVLLAGIALLVVNFVAAALIRAYLTGRMDAEMQRPGRPPSVGGNGGYDPYNPPTGDQNRFRNRFPFAEDEFVIVAYSVNGTVGYRDGSETATELPLIGDFAAVKAHANA